LNTYNKYRRQGFEIFQVSLDQSQSLWERAIKEDALPWTNVCDFMSWESDVVKLYGVETIPANFLIDREGSIITKNLKGDALDKKLSEFIVRIE
jgi:peroxiredoxin